MNLSLNKLYLIKQLDLFKRPIMMRTERSIEGSAFDKYGGSFVGALVSLITFIGLSIYSKQILVDQRQGLLDIFTSQESVI